MNFDVASGIDDSFFPVNPSQDVTALPQHGANDQVPFQCGPRSGHWSVRSTISGSGIDDRTPTLLGIPATSEYGSIRVQRINGGLLRKLAVATEKEQREREDAVRRRGGNEEAVGDLPQRNELKSEQERRGFYIPKFADSRGIRIRARDGQSEVVKQPAPKPTVAPSKDEKKVVDNTESKQTKGPPSPPAGSVKNASVVSQRSKAGSNLIRIVGRNGQESFVELPFLPQNSKSATDFRPNQKATPITQNQENGKDKKKQNALAEKEAKKMREERLAENAAKKLREERLAQEEAQRLQAEQLASKPLMTGALPAKSQASSVARSAKLSKSSTKASDQRFGGVFDYVSKPASVVSSATSMSKVASGSRLNSAQEVAAESAQDKTTPSAAGGWQEVGFGAYEPPASNADRSNRSKCSKPAQADTSSPSLREQAPTDRLSAHGKGPLSHRSSASKTPSVPGSYRLNSNWEKADSNGDWPQDQASSGTKDQRSKARSESVDSFPIVAPSLNNVTYSHLQQSDIGFDVNPQGPTIFAGRGWISPHPLSEAPSWAREEPDPVIKLPSGAAIRTESGVETMTYEEWLNVQNQPDSNAGSRATASKIQTVVSSSQKHSQRTFEADPVESGRRNISRTSSHASKYDVGSWGFRTHAQETSRNYRTPTVKTDSEVGSGPRTASKHSEAGDGPRNPSRHGKASNAGAWSRSRHSKPSEAVFNGVEVQDEDGNTKTFLKMPWDRPQSRESSGFNNAGQNYF